VLFALVVLAAIFALAWHTWVANFALAVLASTLCTAGVFWAFTASHFGWLDLVFLKNSLIALSVSLVVSLLVGFLPAFRRRRLRNS